MKNLDIIMPVKDSLATAKQAIKAILDSGFVVRVYDDFSSQESSAELDDLAQKWGFDIVHLSNLTTHPSPNYRLVLCLAQQKAIDNNADLMIIESDVIINKNTIELLHKEAQKEHIGIVAAATEDENHNINYPYEFAAHAAAEGKEIWQTDKHLSFCCTILTNRLLHAFSFSQLDEKKNWYDVFLSHQSLELGFKNVLMPNNRVLHLPHSSRPWKKLKYTNPILYYWRKLTKRLDRI
ncbi:MAG: glycosyltransferase family 2 protein [Paludibacteraceae bacterium]|nr:glycosyltransferase family 2 protein [Paludibacteraceae bacterium]